jgi:hypothetical protein
MTNQPKDGDTKKMVVIKGKGTKYEQRIVTDVDLFWSTTLQVWVSIPE